MRIELCLEMQLQSFGCCYPVPLSFQKKTNSLKKKRRYFPCSWIVMTLRFQQEDVIGNCPTRMPNCSSNHLANFRHITYPSTHHFFSKQAIFLFFGGSNSHGFQFPRISVMIQVYFPCHGASAMPSTKRWPTKCLEATCCKSHIPQPGHPTL